MVGNMGILEDSRTTNSMVGNQGILEGSNNSNHTVVNSNNMVDNHSSMVVSSNTVDHHSSMAVNSNMLDHNNTVASSSTKDRDKSRRWRSQMTRPAAAAVWSCKAMDPQTAAPEPPIA